MKNLGGALCVAFGLIVGIVYAAEARHSDARHCADDYRRFCNEWGLEFGVWKTACAGMATA